MLNPKFKNKFPLAYKYFSGLLEAKESNQRNFPQALIFEGNDTIGQYLFALELAKNLNCLENKEIDCECLNCKWIKTHTHPCVNNVSQLHFKDDDDKTTMQISVKQAKKIVNTLSLSSDYYRVFIFFSSNAKELNDEQRNEFREFGYDDNIDYQILPLEYKTFNEESINSLLKSVEEPNENTLFIFLTKSKENIISTIVSRCQTFKLSKKKVSKDFSKFVHLFQNSFEVNNLNSFDLAQLFLNTAQEENIELDEFLSLYLDYLGEILKNNINSDIAIKNIQNNIEIVNHSIKQYRAKINSKNVLEEMFLRLARGF